jgi:hypothetical protein
MFPKYTPEQATRQHASKEERRTMCETCLEGQRHSACTPPCNCICWEIEAIHPVPQELVLLRAEYQFVPAAEIKRRQIEAELQRSR